MDILNGWIREGYQRKLRNGNLKVRNQIKINLDGWDKTMMVQQELTEDDRDTQ